MRSRPSTILISMTVGFLTLPSVTDVSATGTTPQIPSERRTTRPSMKPSRQNSRRKISRAKISHPKIRRSEEELGPPVSDSMLESRLVTVRSYYTRPGDNLVKIAHLLYGHKTWWSRIKDMNPHLGKTGALDPLPIAREIRYRAPEIGDQYVVQPGDWLIRIAQWKYGGISYWSDLYHRHSGQIHDPNLIQPGDVLILTDGGTISNMATGQVIAEEPSALRKIASTAEGAYFYLESQPYFLAGFLAGLILLLLSPLRWLFSRVLQTQEAYSEIGFDPLRQKGGGKRPQKLLRAKPGQYPETFKKRPLEKYQVDRRWIPSESGSVNRRPGYFSLSPSRFKKFLISRKKKSLD